MHQHRHSHDHHHGHGHGHVHGADALPGANASADDRRRFAISVGVLVTFLAIQVAGGIVFNSLALLSDSVHMVGDVAAILLAATAARLAARPASSVHTYGLGRAELLTALVNGATLVGAATWIGIEAIRRLGDPGDVHGAGVVVVAAAGLLANLVVAWLLSRSSAENINARAAMQHAMVDAASSIAVIVAGAAIALGSPAIVDPLLGMLIGLVAGIGGIRTLRASASLLLDATPPGIDLDEVATTLAHPNAVHDVHDLHVWHIGARRMALTAHLLVEPGAPIEQIAEHLTAAVKQRFGIDHCTLQILPSRHSQPIPIEPRIDRSTLDERRGDIGG